MIAVKPENDAGKLLAALVAAPGELDAEALGCMFWPAPALPVPPLSWPGAAQAGAAYRAWLASIQGRHQTRERWVRQHAEKASKLLGRLQEQGLVERPRPPQLSAWWHTLTQELSKEAAFARVLFAMEWEKVERDEEELSVVEYLEVQRVHERLLALVAEVEKGPRFTREILGDTPDGTTKRAWGLLVELGIVVPSSYRWPTEAGVALVKSWQQQEAA